MVMWVSRCVVVLTVVLLTHEICFNSEETAGWVSGGKTRKNLTEISEFPQTAGGKGWVRTSE